MSITDLIRIIKNLISIGTICEIDATRALAKVNILDRETDFFPVLSISSSFKRKFTPIRIGEQVLVLCPNGNADFGIIIPSIFNKDSLEPNGSNENIEIAEYEDGTIISYDTKTKELKIDASDKITIICKSINVKCDSAKIDAKSVEVKADTTIVDSPSIDLGKGGKGVVTGECICALTGAPHHDFSSNTMSKK
ncbi:phage baseplate assembly protein V [Sulfurimonas sp.]|uniref:phage baseplate assembly protein V n=1 Tax=Sulfurimonas sp. TaxID=2022749 RepID=UPI002B464497|nr:phage baseplate assembly protein V [Sulfurimonas sp.]